MLCYCLVCQNTSRVLENTGINLQFNPKLSLDRKVSFNYYGTDQMFWGLALPPGLLLSLLVLRLEAVQTEAFIPSPTSVSQSFRAALNPVLLWLWLSKAAAESAFRKRGPVKWRLWLLLHHFICRTAIPFDFQTNSETIIACLIPNNQSCCNKLLRSRTSKFLKMYSFYSLWFAGENSALKYSVVLQSSQTVLGYSSFATASKTYLPQFSINPNQVNHKKTPQHNYCFYCIKQTLLTDDLL